MNGNEESEESLRCFCLIKNRILYRLYQVLVERRQENCLHNKKTSRRLPYVDATFQVLFLHYFDKSGASLLHIVAPGNIRIFVNYLTNGKASNLEETESDTLEVQVTPEKPPVLW